MTPLFLEAAVGRGIKIVAPLLRHLPDTYDYAVVFIERPIAAVLDSQEAMLDRSLGGLAVNEGDVGKDALRDAFEKTLCGARSWLRNSADCDVVYLSHSETVADPRATGETIIDFLESFGDRANFWAEPIRDGSTRASLIDRMSSVFDPSLCRQSARD